MSKVRHIKTGNQYQTLGQAINTTNAHNNQKMKAYVKEEDVNKTFFKNRIECLDARVKRALKNLEDEIACRNRKI